MGGEEELGRVRVAVRVRPMNAQEVGEPAVTCQDPRTLALTQAEAGHVSSTKKFEFDLVAHDGFQQDDLFRHCGARSLLDSAYAGMKVTMFAYGATGSGKTHTMIGPEAQDEEIESDPDLAGLIERAAEYLFAKETTQELRLVASFFEIYNEHVFDLLDASKVPLPVRHNVSSGFYVPGLVELECCSAEDVSAVVTEGRRSRRRAAHKLNRDSSRGHALLSLKVVVGATHVHRGKISFVDLAGNERLSRSHSSDAAETGAINRSLFALGKVIAALTADKDVADKSHVPYRDSTLTKLLMDSLGGDVFTLMIACVSPAQRHLDETLCTLQYARRAKGIVNAPKVALRGATDDGAAADSKAENLLLKAQVEELRAQVAALREENRRLRAGEKLPETTDHAAAAADQPRLASAKSRRGGTASTTTSVGERRRRRPDDASAVSPLTTHGKNPGANSRVSTARRSDASSFGDASDLGARRRARARETTEPVAYAALEAQLRELQQNYAVLETKLHEANTTSKTLEQQQQQQHAWQQQQWQAALAQQQQQQQALYAQQVQHQAAAAYAADPNYLQQFYHQNPEPQVSSPRRDDDATKHSRWRHANQDDHAVHSVRRQATGDVVRRHRDDLKF